MKHQSNIWNSSMQPFFIQIQFTASNYKFVKKIGFNLYFCRSTFFSFIAGVSNLLSIKFKHKSNIYSVNLKRDIKDGTPHADAM